MLTDIRKIVKRNKDFGNEKGKFDPELEKRLLVEEFNEFIKAIDEDDPVEMLDALLDIFWVGCGTLWKKGISARQMARGFDEVCDSNYSKFPVSKLHGKIQKGPNFRPPNLLAVLKEYD